MESVNRRDFEPYLEVMNLRFVFEILWRDFFVFGFENGSKMYET